MKSPFEIIKEITDQFNEHFHLEDKIVVTQDESGISVAYKDRAIRYTHTGEFVGIDGFPKAQ